ncbi:MAG TPA: hypothetical protein VN698_03435 [Bacteroidia bacterium]|nr:hypothetical protein [Bacteroidia bacterium]
MKEIKIPDEIKGKGDNIVQEIKALAENDYNLKDAINNFKKTLQDINKTRLLRQLLVFK